VTAAITAPQRFADVLRSELCKLGSVRSTYLTLLAAVAFNVGLAALLAIFLPGQLSAQDKSTLDTIRVSLGGIHLSQVAFGVLGVLVITSEYATGMIRATLSAVPQRRLLLAAKLIVFAGVALSIATLSSFAAYFVFQAFLADPGLRSSIGDPGVLRAVMGGGLFLTALGLLGLGLGAITRSSAGAIAALFSLLFVPPVLLELLPRAWKTTIGPYVPMEAGAQIFSTRSQADLLAPWAGFGVFSAYAVIALALGFILINRRDA
jgi:ABC-type transport system involved in multi-copper enzyme maturation permease subunit